MPQTRIWKFLFLTSVVLHLLVITGCGDDRVEEAICTNDLELVITGVEALEEAYVGQPIEFAILTNGDRPLDYAFSGLGTFELSTTTTDTLIATFEMAGNQAFSVIASDGCRTALATKTVRVRPCELTDCNDRCVSFEERDESAGDGTCVPRLGCDELGRDGGDCSCEDLELTADCNDFCQPTTVTDLVGDGVCHPNLVCNTFNSDGGDCGETNIQFPIGEFILNLDNQNGVLRGLRATHPSSQAPLVFNVPELNQWWTVGIAQLEVEDNRGNFTVDEDVAITCTTTRMTIHYADNERLILKGELSNETFACSLGYYVELWEKGDGRLGFKAWSDEPAINYFEMESTTAFNERFFGFGEQFSYLDHKGNEVPILSQEQGIGRGRPAISNAVELVASGAGGDSYTTYCALPFYVTNFSRSLYLTNTEYSVFDLREDDFFAIRIHSARPEGAFIAADSMYAAIHRYTDFAGRMPPLPDWIADRVIVGMQGGLDRVEEVAAELEIRNTPIGAYWVQDWVGKRATAIGSQLWWNWELDTETYPAARWQSLVEELQAKGVRMLGYINPFLVDASEKGGVTRNLLDEAFQLDYLVKDHNGIPYELEVTDFPTYLIDLTNPDARTWIKSVIKTNMLDIGLRGWMADFSEALPFDAKLFSGEPASSYHNQYMVDWVKMSQEAVQEAGLDGQVIYFNRAGYNGSQGASTLFWLGDQMVTWDAYDGMQAALKGLITGGISGIPLNHSDIGGYTSISALNVGFTREMNLLERWTELNTFSPAFRTHEGNQPEANAQFYDDAASYDHFARMAKVFAALGPYRRALSVESSQTGIPIVRHPFFEYPDDESWLDLGDTEQQFMFGSEFMVAPILEKDAEERTVRLPAGEWVHLFTGGRYGDTNAATTYTIAAPVGSPPAFYRVGSVVGNEVREALVTQGLAAR